jgi:DNA-binding SARP family transcriptional activator
MDALQVAADNHLDTTWSVRILHKLGDLDMQLLSWREAVKEYEQIRTLAPGDEKARTMLIDLNFRLGNPKAAIAELDNFLKQLLAARNALKAIAVLEELSANYPEDTAVLTRLARMYQDMGRKVDAISQYEKLGELQLNAGQNAQAAETIKTIIALGPDDPEQYQELLAQITV